MCNRLILFISITCTLVFTGCTFHSGNITFNNLKYPVSMSPFLYGQNNEILAKNKDLTVLDSFRYKTTKWVILYGAIPFSSYKVTDKDIVDAINKKIEEVGGEGIIELSVTYSQPTNDFFMFINFLPVFPSWTTLTVEGNIVRSKPINLKEEVNK